LEELARFRGNVFISAEAVGACFRTIPWKLRASTRWDAQVVKNMCDKPRGLVLVTGQRARQSTTLAAMLDKINSEREEHMITDRRSDRIFTHHKKCLVNQREVHADTHHSRIRCAPQLREDPDVVLIVKMRDLETIESALRIAETGHLTFATLHTNSAARRSTVLSTFFRRTSSRKCAHTFDGLEGILCQALLRGRTVRNARLVMESWCQRPGFATWFGKTKFPDLFGDADRYGSGW